MDLTLQKPGDHLFVRSVSEQGIRVGDTWHVDALILSAEHIDPAWDIRTFAQLDTTRLQAIFALAPDLVLLGTGAYQHFLPAELQIEFYRRGIGVEAMATQAACRTFNVLVSEGRRVVAALLPPNAC